MCAVSFLKHAYLLQRRYKLLRAWYIGTIILTAIFVLRSFGDLILAFVYGNYEWILGSASYFVFGAAYTALQFWLVIAFMKQVKAEGPADSVGLVLSEPAAGTGTPYDKLEEEP
jgi:hypothetical protein